MSNHLTTHSTTKEKNENTFVSIDVAKEELVLHILPTNSLYPIPPKESRPSSNGKKLGARRIRGGRTYVRAALSMAALNAIKYCAPLKVFYEKLRTKGKSFKVAIVAVMRKLITILNVMVKTNTCWQEQKTNNERN